jgi:ParB family chromosome partitioning protein
MSARRDRAAEIAVVRTPQPRSTHRAVAGASERRLPGAMEVPIEQVVADPAQPRKDWGHNDGPRRLAELADSIREFGVLQPLLVREEGTIRDGRQRYMIIAGARRRSAAEQANLATVPVVLRDEETARVRVLQLVENLQRQELSPLDEARAYQELIDLEGLTPPGLAEKLHVSAQHVRDRLRVLADQVLADAVERRQIPPSVARDIMKLPEEEVERFRARVQAGDRVHLNDVAETRARLTAAGVVNPRRKPPRGAPTDERSASTNRSDRAAGIEPREGSDSAAVGGSAGLPPSDHEPSGLDEQTVFVQGTGILPYARDPVAVRGREQTVFVPGASPGDDGEGSRHRSADATTATDVADALAAVLAEGLQGVRRERAVELLLHADTDAAWSAVYARLRSLLGIEQHP